MLFFVSFALDKGLCRWSSVYIETPALKVVFGMDGNVVTGEIRNILASAFDDHGERFFTWFRSIEQCNSLKCYFVLTPFF